MSPYTVFQHRDHKLLPWNIMVEMVFIILRLGKVLLSDLLGMGWSHKCYCTPLEYYCLLLPEIGLEGACGNFQATGWWMHSGQSS